MSELLLKKRLHISGLTPSISPEDLERRLSSFGKVMAMDGFGAHDALGDPRKFGFVTMEIGAKELAKCLNVLSGSMWRGAKLRIGEAKPDFRERLAEIHSWSPLQPVRPRRTRARNYGHVSSTLPLTPLSATAAASTPGWISTPSGRVVRPMRMRPERPLEPMHGDLSVSKVKGVNGRAKKRVKPPPARARRRLIDPTKWDSVSLKGVFLDTISIPLLTSNDVPKPLDRMKYGTMDEENEETTKDNSTGSDVDLPQYVSQLAQDHACAIPSARDSQEAALESPSRMQDATQSSSVRDEANAALALLGKMFGDNEDWDGRESVTEMEGLVLEDNQMTGKEMRVGEVDDIEIVPRDFGSDRSTVAGKDKGKGKEQSLREVHFGHEDDMDPEAAHDADIPMEGPPVGFEVSVQTAEPVPRADLKALFAPREEASFSLLDHLDLDLDLDLDADIFGTSAPYGVSQEDGHPSESVLPPPHTVQVPATMLTTNARSRMMLDPSLPLLFPPPDSLLYPLTAPSDPTTTFRRHPMCFLFPLATQVRGLRHLPPSATFTRSPQDTSEFIRETWEKEKSTLTHEWKKAWREAKGTRRRKVGAGWEV